MESILKMLTKDQKDYLNEIYFNPKNVAAFSGLEKLWKAVRPSGNVTKKQLKLWLREQDTYTAFFPLKKKFKRPKTISPRTNFIWGSDVAYMLAFKEENDNHPFFVVFIDIFSRYAYAEPLKNLQARTMLSAMQEVFEDVQPNLLYTDAGSEYVNRAVRQYLKIKNIKHYISRNEKKVAHAERLIKQIKRKLFQYMSEKNTHRWIDVLPDVINAYNNSFHRAIKMTPKQARAKKKNYKVWTNQYFNHPLKTLEDDDVKRPRTKKKPYKFEIGERVKISALQRPFSREYDEKFSTETFTVTDRRMQEGIQSYNIKDEMNEPIIGWFYPQELLNVVVPNDKKYKIEKVLKRRTRKEKQELFVKFQGLQKKFNTWVSDFERIY